MQCKVENPDDSVMKPLFESDSQLTAGLAIMDAFPLGMLGYLSAEEKAKREGRIDEFYHKVKKLAEEVAQKIDESAFN